MNILVERAKRLLEQEDYTCVVIKGNVEYTSRDRGVKPLLDWIDNNVDLQNAVVADKVVGKAAAFLYVLLGVEEIYAGVLSGPAKKVLDDYSIKVSFGQMVDAIRNRDNAGFCPMESSVWTVEEPAMAYKVILDTKARLSQKS